MSVWAAIKQGYGNKRARNELSKAGYREDLNLHSDNQQVYYNPSKRQTIVNIAGTHNAKDWVTDAYLSVGLLKKTTRYKQAKDTLEKARAAHPEASITVTGHSLGGGIASSIATGSDTIVTLDKASSWNQKIRPNETSYRASGDVVSTFNANQSNVITIARPQRWDEKIASIALPAVAKAFGVPPIAAIAAKTAYSALVSHNVDWLPHNIRI
jgi:hypothetical protein